MPGPDIGRQRFTHPSSFCNLAKGLAELEPSVGLVLEVAFDVAEPPPPRSGFAMRPKLRGEDVAAFCAGSIIMSTINDREKVRIRTPSLIQPLLHLLELSFKFLVLHCEPPISVLEQGLQILDPFISRE